MRKHGFPLNSVMVKHEAKHIFCTLKVNEYPPKQKLDVNGDVVIKYPMVLSDKW